MWSSSADQAPWIGRRFALAIAARPLTAPRRVSIFRLVGLIRTGTPARNPYTPEKRTGYTAAQIFSRRRDAPVTAHEGNRAPHAADRPRVDQGTPPASNISSPPRSVELIAAFRPCLGVRLAPYRRKEPMAAINSV